MKLGTLKHIKELEKEIQLLEILLIIISPIWLLTGFLLASWLIGGSLL